MSSIDIADDAISSATLLDNLFISPPDLVENY